MVDAPETMVQPKQVVCPPAASRTSAAAEQPLRLLRREIEDLKRVLSRQKSSSAVPAEGSALRGSYRVRDRRRLTAAIVMGSHGDPLFDFEAPPGARLDSCVVRRSMLVGSSRPGDLIEPVVATFLVACPPLLALPEST